MIHPRVQLVTAEVVATMRGTTTEAVYRDVDTGDGWMWVFNVGTRKERALRFWTREQISPAATRNLSLDEVVTALVPRRELAPGMQKWEVGELLRVSRQRLMDMDLNFVPRAGGMWVATSELESFFRRRWLFANTRS